jgi:uncharacterized OB-fold protein
MTGEGQPSFVPEIIIEDDDDARYWQGIRDHALALQQCGTCGRFRWPPAAFCNQCSTRGGTWTLVSGIGSVASWTVTRHTFLPEFRDEVPYVLVVVALVEQDDLMLVGRIVGCAPETVHAGMAVEVAYVDHSADSTTACWRPRQL